MDLRNRSCPICDSGVTMTLASSDGSYQYVREFKDDFPSPVVSQCAKCDFVFLNPVMTDESYKEFYNNDAQRAFVARVSGETEKKYRAKVSRDDTNRAKLIRRYTDHQRMLLDVGTGNSNFVSLFDGALGIDISEPRVRAAQERGLNVELCDIYDYNGEEPSMVTLFHVLEHIPEPRPFLSRIYDVLNYYSDLIVEVPNLDDALVGLEKYKDFYYQNAHCSYFTPKTLKRLLNSEGFLVKKEIRLQRYSFDNHLHWLLKGKPGKFEALSAVNGVYSALLKTIRRHDTIFLICNKG